MSSKPQDPQPPGEPPDADAAVPTQPQQRRMTPELVEALFDRLGQRVNQRLKHLDEPDV